MATRKRMDEIKRKMGNFRKSTSATKSTSAMDVLGVYPSIGGRIEFSDEYLEASSKIGINMSDEEAYAIVQATYSDEMLKRSLLNIYKARRDMGDIPLEAFTFMSESYLKTHNIL